MRIADVTLAQVRAGRTWRVRDPDQLYDGRALEEVEIEDIAEPDQDDLVVYAGVTVTQSKRVRAILLLRRVGDYGYGGDYCELKEGNWRQVGLESDPSAEFSNEYIANPLCDDPSFDSDDGQLREMHSAKFEEWARRLEE